ncbi:MAG: peptidylprolyl isomerase [Gammaproteobacteria bacterium]|nr:peptidylprolyl isomerase [Gammaproteobacteria bacterium]
MFSNKRFPLNHIIPVRQIFQLCFLLLFSISTVCHAELKLLDEIVAVVNEDVITKTQLDNRIVDFQKQLQLSQISRIDPESLKKQVLERMIRDTIQLQLAKQFGITVDDLMLNRMLEQLAKSNNMSLEDFRETIEAENLSYARFREQTRNEIIINQLQQRVVASKINVSDQEIRQHIDQNENNDSSRISYRIRQILIATPETASPEALQKAKAIADSVYKKILNGSKFEDMAIKYSDGRNALKGGDLGERKANELPQLFVDAVSNLDPGEISKPIQSASGYHILELVSSSNDQVMVQQSKVRQILIRTSSEVSDDQAREKLLELKQKIENGASFAELASEFSEDPETKVTGGDIGWTNTDDFDTVFKDVASRLELNEISQPFKTSFGWLVIEVQDRRQYNQGKENKENQARNAIKARKIDEELRLWLRRIRDEAYVEFIDK